MSTAPDDRAAQRAGHSPLPWAQDSRVPTRIVAADGHRTIGSTGGYQDGRMDPDALTRQNEANAELIVAAVNAHAGLLAALAPFAEFARQWDRQPISNIGDDFYSIHVGTPFEATLRLSDLRAAAKAIAAAEKGGARA